MRNHPYAGAGDKPSLWAFVRPSKMRDPFGVYKCITVEDKRFFYCNIKTVSYTHLDVYKRQCLTKQ